MRQIPNIFPDGVYATGLNIKWQDGPIGDEFNGASVEVVLRAAAARLTQLNEKQHSIYNMKAISYINSAIAALDNRTRDRFNRGVLGTEHE